MPNEAINWIPWQRYVLRLHITNNNQTQIVFLGRFRLRKSAQKWADRLSNYSGYGPEVIDTKREV